MRAIVRGPLGAKSITAQPCSLRWVVENFNRVLAQYWHLYDPRFGKISVSWLRFYLTLKSLGIKLIRSCLRKFKGLAREISQKELSYLVTRRLTKGWSLIDEVNKNRSNF